MKNFKDTKLGMKWASMNPKTKKWIAAGTLSVVMLGAGTGIGVLAAEKHDAGKHMSRETIVNKARPSMENMEEKKDFSTADKMPGAEEGSSSMRKSGKKSGTKSVKNLVEKYESLDADTKKKVQSVLGLSDKEILALDEEKAAEVLNGLSDEKKEELKTILKEAAAAAKEEAGVNKDETAGTDKKKPSSNNNASSSDKNDTTSSATTSEKV